MRTSTLLASALFGSLAIAAPVNKRALITKTEVVVETQIVYVTVWEPQQPIAEATTSPGLFYEQPAKPKTTSKAEPTTSAAYIPPKEEKPSSSAPPPPPTPTPSTTAAPEYTTLPPAPKPSSTSVKEEPAPVYTPPVVEEPAPVYTPPVVEQPAPTTSAAPAPETSAPAAQPSPPSNNHGGEQFTGDVTVYDTYNGKGACGTDLSDSEYTAAISKDQWGADVWGSADNINKNPWCGKSVTVNLKGKSVTVRIMDKCMGCKPGDIDVTRAAWNELTNSEYGSRYVGAWST